MLDKREPEEQVSQAGICLHCGAAVTEPQSVCPSCGTSLNAAWPPAPTGDVPFLPLGAKTLTGRVWADFLVGAGGQYLLHLVTARLLVPLIPATNPALTQDWSPVLGLLGVAVAEMFELIVFGLLGYFILRRFSPAAARGSGYASLALVAVLLGAFFTCRPLAY